MFSAFRFRWSSEQCDCEHSLHTVRPHNEWDRTPSDVYVTDTDHRHHRSSAMPARREEYHSRPQRDVPIRFYHRDMPYYEFTNFAEYSVRWRGRKYPTAEHLFQAMKFMDHEPHIAERIRKMSTPRAALQEATRLRSLQRRDWFDVNLGLMEEILKAKLEQHPSLQYTLLETENRELIEDSPVDSFWGVGADGRGKNELGKALMRLRDKLRERNYESSTSYRTHYWMSAMESPLNFRYLVDVCLTETS